MTWIPIAMVLIVLLMYWIRTGPNWRVHLIDNKQQYHRCQIQVNYKINEPIVIKFWYRAKKPVSFTHAVVESPFLQRYFPFEYILDRRDMVDGEYVLRLEEVTS
jgi:hypothetical protein